MTNHLDPIGCPDNPGAPPHDNALTLMENLLQGRPEEQVADECLRDPAGSLMRRLSTSTWASELDYSQDSTAASGAPAGTSGLPPPLDMGVRVNQVSLGDIGFYGIPLSGLDLWTTDQFANSGVGLAGVDALSQSNGAAQLDAGTRELPNNLSYFLSREAAPEPVAAGVQVPPGSSPDVSALQQAEPLVTTPCDCSERESRRHRGSSHPLHAVFQKQSSEQSLRKRIRIPEPGPNADPAESADYMCGPPKVGSIANTAEERQETEQPYALLPFDPARAFETLSLEQPCIRYQRFYDQLGRAGGRRDDQEALPYHDPAPLVDVKYETVNLGEYDMCEVVVSWHLPRLTASPDRPADAVPIRRVFGINAGMTLFNLHRIICISMGLSDDSQASAFNHVWVLPSNNTYGGGPLTKSRASRVARVKVTTDRAVEYRHSITVSLDSSSRVVATPESVLLYVLGCVQLHVQLAGVMRNRTKQNSLIWVPRCIANGTYGTGPPSGTDWNSSAEICNHIPSFQVDVHKINTQFIDTRFSKNTSFSRRTKMIRAEGIDEDILRCYSESIHDFWQDPERVRDLSVRVTRQSMSGTKRRCLESRRSQRSLEHEEYCEDGSHAQEHATPSAELLAWAHACEPAVAADQPALGSLAWHDSPAPFQPFVSFPSFDVAHYADLQGDPSTFLGISSCPSPFVSLPFPFPFSSDTIPSSPPSPSTVAPLAQTCVPHENLKEESGAAHAVKPSEDSSSICAVAEPPNAGVSANVERAGASHGVRRNRRATKKTAQGNTANDAQAPAETPDPDLTPALDAAALSLPQPSSLGASHTQDGALSKTLCETRTAWGSDPSPEGSCCSTDPGDRDVADIHLLTGSLQEDSKGVSFSCLPGFAESGDSSQLTGDQGVAAADRPSIPQLWSTVQFVLRDDGSKTLEPKNPEVRTAC
ncbi:hypothetical protein BESB_082470 [Besnoitia besnoiti]|uniref:Uncharacterized protein n=1 Tax=Besnoitia besnoiti TaxID=94643 RepID=A0A2A9M3I3_BESBE|nr:hypothetical protein BESB_082470 [Besnoitia besnoiti]PFH33048.1 hypothetical protein BESB_082470 [Besnoitia besnoiti]